MKSRATTLGDDWPGHGRPSDAVLRMDGGHRPDVEEPCCTARSLTAARGRALAAAGHGSRVLVADANYPHSTGTPAPSAWCHSNLRPGLVTVDDVLEVLVAAVPLSRATVRDPRTVNCVPAHAGFGDPR